MDKITISEIIKKRRSIRRFRQKVIPAGILEKMVEAARMAPSGSNLQPWEFIVVNEKPMVDKVFSTLAWAGYLGKEGPPAEGKKPTAYIVMLNNNNIKKPPPQRDFGAAAENILLTATEEGIGSCWIGSVERKKLAEILKIPQNYEIDSVIALGYPDETPVVEEYKNSIKYWKDNQKILHVPKKSLKSIIHYNTF
jgi:nitroreductase